MASSSFQWDNDAGTSQGLRPREALLITPSPESSALIDLGRPKNFLSFDLDVVLVLAVVVFLANCTNNTAFGISMSIADLPCVMLAPGIPG